MSELGGRYRIERELARGGMGKVLLVHDQLLEREVAVKTLLAGTSADAQVRFLEEAQITGQLAHPNIVPVHELGLAGDEVFLAMKKVSGQDLRELVRAVTEDEQVRARYPLSRVLRLFLKICEAMAYAHERGVIHRDLKPANVMLGDGDEVLVMDWGLARPIGDEGSIVSQARASASTQSGTGELTQEGAVVGTPAYMPPEQADGEPLDATADVYALGATLYHLLTRRPPYTGSSFQVLSALFKGPPPRPRTIVPDLPLAIEGIVLKAMAPERGDRYPDAAALAREVEAYLDGRAVSAHRETLGEAVGRLLRRHRVLFGSSLVALLLVAVAAVFANAAVRGRRAEADAAQAEAQIAKEQTLGAAEQAAAALRQADAVGGASDPIRGAAQFVVRCRGPVSVNRAQQAYRSEVVEPLRRAEEALAGLPQADLEAQVVRDSRANLAAVRRSADRALVETLLARDPWVASARLEGMETLGDERPLLEARALLRQWRSVEALAVLNQAVEPKDEAARTASSALRLTLERASPARQRVAYELALRSLRPEEPDWLHGWLVLRLCEALARLGELGSAAEVAPQGIPTTAHQALAKARAMNPHDAWIEELRVRFLLPLNHGVDARRDGLSPAIGRLLTLQERLHRVWLGVSGKPKRKKAGDEGQWKVLTDQIATTRREIAEGRYRIPEFILQRFAAEGALILKKLPEARQLVERALEGSPDDVETIALQAAISLRGERLAEARAAADRALALDPEHGRANYVKGEALRRAGDVSAAKAFLELGARGSIQFERWLRLAQCLEGCDDAADWERGVAAARRAVELAPVMLDYCDPRVEVLAEDPELPRTQARLYERLGQRGPAAVLYARAAIFQENAATRYWTDGRGPAPRSRDGSDFLAVARLHEELGLPAEALSFYLRAAATPNTRETALAAVARIEKALRAR